MNRKHRRARDLIRELDRDLDRVFALDLDRIRALYRGVDSFYALERDLDHASKLRRDLVFDRDFARDLDPDRALALAQVLDRTCALALALDRDLTRDLRALHGKARDLTRALKPEPESPGERLEARPARWLAELAGLLLQSQDRTRYTEEWWAELMALAQAGVPRRGQVAYALRLALSAWPLRTALRQGCRREEKV